MIPKTTYKGLWWFPGKSENQMSGELSIYEDGSISLSAVWNENPNSAVELNEENRKEIPIIHGYARNSVNNAECQFTLFENQIRQSSISSLAVFTIISRYAVEHYHFKAKKSLLIKSAFIKLSLFHEWVNVSGVKNAKRNFESGSSVSFDYTQPKSITLLKNKQLHMYIWFYASTTQERRKFELSEEPILNIEFAEKVTFNEFTRYYEMIRNFFSFSISLPLACEEIIFHQYSSEELKERNMSHQLGIPFYISDNRTYTKHKSLSGQSMLLNYELIKTNRAKVIKSWMRVNDLFEPVLKLYFDTIYNPGIYRENAFLNFVMGLEIYHRVSFPEFDGKDDIYQKKLEAISKQIAHKNDREWLMTRMTKRKEISLYNRLVYLLNRTPEISARIFGEKENFCRLVSNTRNYLVHFDPENKRKGIAQGEKLLELIGKTKILIQIQLLLELGFQEYEIDIRIKHAISNWYPWNR